MLKLIRNYSFIVFCLIIFKASVLVNSLGSHGICVLPDGSDLSGD